eukprot:1500518-Amphidinium_carterae.2
MSIANASPTSSRVWWTHPGGICPKQRIDAKYTHVGHEDEDDDDNDEDDDDDDDDNDDDNSGDDDDDDDVPNAMHCVCNVLYIKKGKGRNAW